MPLDLPGLIAEYWCRAGRGRHLQRHQRHSGLECRGPGEVSTHGGAAERRRPRRATIVAGKVAGDFPGSPVTLDARGWC